MTKHMTPTYSPIAEVVPGMWSCVQIAEGQGDAEPIYVIRPLKPCSQCNRPTVNWTTVSVKKVDGGLLDLCPSCYRIHRGNEPLPLEETA